MHFFHGQAFRQIGPLKVKIYLAKNLSSVILDTRKVNYRVYADLGFFGCFWDGGVFFPCMYDFMILLLIKSENQSNL